MEEAARAGDMARMKYLRSKGHAWGDAHHITALMGNHGALAWIYEQAHVVREREDTLPQLMRLVLEEDETEEETESHRKCMKIILDKRQVQSEIIKPPFTTIEYLDHPSAIPIKNRM